MTAIDAIKTPRLRLGLLLFIAGMTGAIVLTVTVLPQFLKEASLPVPSYLILLASVAQNAFYIALAVWLGVSLAPKVGISAPASAQGRGS